MVNLLRIMSVMLLAFTLMIGTPSIHFDGTNTTVSFGSEAQAKPGRSSSRPKSRPSKPRSSKPRPQKPKATKPRPSKPKATKPSPSKPKATKPKAKKPVAAPTKPGQRMNLGANKPPNPKTVKRAPKSVMGPAVQKARSSAAYKTRQASLNKTRASNPVARNLGSKPVSSTTIRTTRTTYYRSNPVGSRYASRYEGYNRGNSYGGFDSGFLMVMLFSEDPGSAALWYGMTGSPWLAIMMSDTKDAAKANGDSALLARVEAIEAENARLKAAGTKPMPIDATLADMGVAPEVALSEEVLTGQAKIPLKIGTGDVTGNYYSSCLAIGRALGGEFDVSCIPTAGSSENLNGCRSGEFDACFIQNNVKISRKVKYPYSASIYPEAVYFLVNKASGITNLNQVKGNYKMLAGPELSGTHAGMADLVRIEYDNSLIRSDLKHLRGKFLNASYDDMAAAVANNPKTVGFYISSSDSDWMKKIDSKYAGKICLAQVQDKDLDDAVDGSGNSIFTNSELSDVVYQNLLCGKSKMQTVAVPATFNISPVWVSRYGDSAAQGVMTGLGYLYAN